MGNMGIFPIFSGCGTVETFQIDPLLEIAKTFTTGQGYIDPIGGATQFGRGTGRSDAQEVVHREQGHIGGRI